MENGWKLQLHMHCKLSTDVSFVLRGPGPCQRKDHEASDRAASCGSSFFGTRGRVFARLCCSEATRGIWSLTEAVALHL